MEDIFDIREESCRPVTDEQIEEALRPISFRSFRGQDTVVENLSVFVQAAAMRGDSLDHVLLHGPQAWERPRSPISSQQSWVLALK